MLSEICLKNRPVWWRGRVHGTRDEQDKMGQYVNNHWSQVIHTWDLLYYSNAVFIWVLLECKIQRNERRKGRKIDYLDG